MSLQSGSGSRIERYFLDAANLRLCLQNNMEDYDFANRGGRIVYLMDTNIVRFFLHPSSEVEHVAAFGSMAAHDYLPATASITAEFLFSRGLAGQHDSPAFIAPSHGDEVLDIICGMRKDSVPEETGPSSMTQGTVQELQKLLDKFSARKIGPQKAAAELRKLVPAAAKYLLEGAGSEATHLRRLHDEDLLRPLALHTAATREVMEFNKDTKRLVEEWERSIRHERPTKMPDDAKKIQRDAEALVQTILLDRAALHNYPPVRYLMITADRTLFDAYTKRFWLDRDTDRNTRFVLRIPLQYAPILNVMEMPNGVQTSEIINRARDTLDSLFANLRSVDPGYPHTLSMHRILARISKGLPEAFLTIYGFNPFEFDEESVKLFQMIRDDWHESFRSGVVLNAELLTRRMQAEFDRLALLLRKDTDLRTAIHEDQQRILDQVESAHLAFSNNINMRLITRTMDRDATVSAQRAPLILRAHFPRIIGEKRLEDVLDRLVAKDHRLIVLINDKLKEFIDFEGFFFAACVAHRSGRWIAAWHFARRALEQRSADEVLDREWHEAAYLVVSATRYALPSEEAVEHAFELLDRLKEHCRREKDTFGLARALCEYTSLVLIVLYADRLLPKFVNPAFTEKIQFYLPKFSLWLREATEALASTGNRPDEFAEGRMRMKMHLHSNVISTEVLIRIIGIEDKVADHIALTDNDISKALAELVPWLESAQCPPIIAAECFMIQYANGTIELEEAKKKLDVLLQRARSEGYRLELDRAEFEYFEKILSEETTMPGTLVTSRRRPVSAASRVEALSV